MTNKSKSSVGYKGNVSVKIVGSNGKVNKQYKGKNNGELPLFKYLAYAIGGNFESQSTPKFIVTYNKDSDEHYTPTCSRPTLKSSEEYDFDAVDSATVNLSFTIPGTIFISGVKTNAVMLYDSENYTTFNTSNKQPSAVYELDEETEVSADENVVVVWSLTIGNNIEQEESELQGE